MNTREKALLWWKHTTLAEKMRLTESYYKGRQHSTLTGREIEAIWTAEGHNEKVTPHRLAWI